MSFSIEWSSRALKFLNKLQKDIALRIWNKVDQIKQNPFRFLEHYEGDYYKLRIGDYRALIDIDFKNKIIYVETLDKRGRIYKS